MIYTGDCLKILPTLEAESVHCCVTSPPYWGLRDYGVPGQLGLEPNPEQYVMKMVEVFSLVHRVLRNDGTLWINLGDTYTSGNRTHRRDADSKNLAALQTFDRISTPPGLKPKDLIGIPWLVAFALQRAGWYLRQDIIWAKPNPMPESVTDRCTKSHEYIFLLTKSARYYYDAEAIKEDFADDRMGNPNGGGQYAKDAFVLLGTQKGLSKGKWNEDGKMTGRNKRSVWTITTRPFKEAHFATFPPEIPEICIKAGSKTGDTILDPFSGAGTTGMVAEKLGRKYIGIELNPSYVSMSEDRIYAEVGGLL